MKFIIVPLLILLTVSFTYAFSQEQFKPIDSIGFADNRHLLTMQKPTICVFEPEDNSNPYPFDELFELVELSVVEWVTKLENATGNKGVWQVDIKMIDNKTSFQKSTWQYSKECQVGINFLGVPTLFIQDGTYFKGGVYRHSGTSVFHDMILYTWDYFPADPRIIANGTWSIDPDMETYHFIVNATDKRLLLTTIKHELGHSFGLNHYKWNGTYLARDGYDTEQAKRSIMYAITDRFYDPNKQIRDMDIEAIILKYGEDGWSGLTDWKIKEYAKYQ